MSNTDNAAGSAANLSQADLLAKLAKLEAENAKLKASNSHGVTVKPGAKGNLSLYGLGRFPVTLYGSQWSVIIDNVETIRTAIEVAEDLKCLAVKGAPMSLDDDLLASLRAKFATELAKRLAENA